MFLAKFTGKHLRQGLFFNNVGVSWRLFHQPSCSYRLCSHKNTLLFFFLYSFYYSYDSQNSWGKGITHLRTQNWDISQKLKPYFYRSSAVRPESGTSNTVTNELRAIKVKDLIDLTLHKKWSFPLRKSMGWFLYHNGLRHERVKSET